jgi:CRISPR/Cas system CSM-associated protein Csm3 (group 7 of RAMP superfamily)
MNGQAQRNPGGRRGRGITERISVAGTLVLDTPAHLGGGETEGLTDMPLLRDARDGQTPLLTGTSIAGALRNYVHEYMQGYRQPPTAAEAAARLFGEIDQKVSVQSWLMVDDALAKVHPGTELRDGVALDPKTRTAEDDKKFDIELLQAGTQFELGFELLLSEDNRELLAVLALALRGLEQGEIGLGSRKRRGLGQCRVSEWRVRRYAVTAPQGLVAWLANDAADEKSGADIAQLLGVDLAPSEDRREVFSIDGEFQLKSSLLIRSGAGAAGDPDMVHLRSNRNGSEQPILSGSSLAGATRARALRIANTVLKQGGAGLVDAMFGKRIRGRKDKPSGSRVVTRETVVKSRRDLVHGRVKIDRFTGGAYPQALFFQQPVFGGDGSEVKITLELRQARPAEIGLLLLVLKDLWTGDLPLGGESSVGRGRLQGRHVTLTHRQPGKAEKTWKLTQRAAGGLDFGGDGRPEELEAFVNALHSYQEGKSE